MVTPRARQVQRALRFFPLGADDGAPPGLEVDARGGLRTVAGAAAVRQSLMTLLSTRPGERVMRPDYGCDLDAVAFAPMGPTTYTLVELMVRRSVEAFEPRAFIHRVAVAADPDVAERLLITLVYSARGEADEDFLTFSVATRPDEAPA
jgi:uncharacterized protein